MLWGFKPYIDLFPNLRGSKNFISLFEKRQFQFRRLFTRIWPVYDKRIACKKPLRKVSKYCPLFFSSGWIGREDKAFIAEERNKIVEILSPSDEIKKRVKSYITKHEGTCYVGVHMRRGDYESFFDGRFFYDNAFYYAIMEQLYEQLHKTFSDVKFVICSNDVFDIHSESLLDGKTYGKENVLRVENANGITDLYALSQCDYIIGPPSTFSLWAAFYGDKKHRFIKGHEDNRISIDEFRNVDSFTNPFKEFRKYWKGEIL